MNANAGSGLPPARVAPTPARRGPIAITGAAGMLGRAFRELFASRGIEHTGFSRAELDITSPSSVAQLASFATVINCAAWTDVDGAEKDEAGAHRLNAEGVRVLAERCLAADATLVHFGTDYVFAGNGTTPYPLDAPIAPLNAYGRSKAEGEVVLRDAIERGARVLYIRTSWLYGPWGKNFVRTIASASSQRPELKVVDDQRGRPTSVLNLARTTLELLNRNVLGVSHVTDGGECTWFGLASEIVRCLGRSGCIVSPCTSAEFPRPAARPHYSVLSLDNVQALVGPMPNWRQCLAEVLAKLE